MSLACPRPAIARRSADSTHSLISPPVKPFLNILSLPVDICPFLFQYTSIHDVLSLRQTCRSLHGVTQFRCVWQSILTGLIRKNLPIPGLENRAPESLSASELEKLARKSIRFHRNWTSLSPVPTNKLIVRCDALPSQPGDVAQSFEFLPGRGQRYLLSFSQRRNLVFSVECWDLKASPPRCVAKHIVNHCGSLAVNREQGGPVVLAIQSPDIEFLGINFSEKNPASGFVSVAKIPRRTDRLVALHGSLCVTQDEQNHLYLWNTANTGAHLELRGYRKTSEKTFELIIQGDAVIVIRHTRLEIYATSSPGIKNAVIYPVAQHTLQWALDSVSVAPQISWSPNPEKHAPINILLRFGSRLPVNLIHHFVLHPDPSYNGSKPVTSNNVPYDVVPVLRRQIGSPVPLFSNYHMAVGSRGTAVWINSHAEDYFGRGNCGQRLAGSLPGGSASDAEDDEWEEDSMQTESSMDSSVFGYCENNEWTRVAVDEEEGRIAVGYVGGTVGVHEYA